MNLSADMADALARDARFLILRELTAQVDGRLNEVGLRRILDAHAIKRSRDWLVTQLNRLVELEAVGLHNVGGVVIAAIQPAGRDHVEGRSVIGGVSRPHELGG